MKNVGARGCEHAPCPCGLSKAPHPCAQTLNPTQNPTLTPTLTLTLTLSTHLAPAVAAERRVLAQLHVQLL
jgi:hypothetical protein